MANGAGIGPTVHSATVLTSWKEIARYMGKGVRTVQRWEQDFGLPVRRPQGSTKKAVLARPCDLDAWIALRCASRGQVATHAAPAASTVSDGRRQHLSRLCSLNAQIETSRMLRESNRALLDEMHAALDLLREQLLTLRPGPTAS
jgi:hypothetical protein